MPHALTMQPSTTFDSIESVPWDFSNVDDEVPFSNLLESDSGVQETIPSHILQASKELAICWSENGMEFIDAINPMTNQSARRKMQAWGPFLPLAIDIIKCSTAQMSCPPADGFQSDSGPGERNPSRLSSGSERDNVYLPSSPTGVGCEPTHKPLPSGSTRTTSTSTPISASASISSPPRKRPPTEKRTRGSASSRNRQAAKDQVEDIRVKLSLCRVRRERLNDLVCPVIDCQYKQLNGRMPDFRRHIKTHIPKDTEIRCKGVPWQDFTRHRHLFPKIPVNERPYSLPGEDGLWIGGCLKTFSRADALKRHRRNTSCVALD